MSDLVSPARREEVLLAALAGTLASLLAWFGPPGGDLAAHDYLRALFLSHGFTLWDNFWYAGRYSFIAYSVLYYPLAAVLGIKVLTVVTVAIGVLAFAVVVGREWGSTARWSTWTFAGVWVGTVLVGALPFVLGVALGLLAVWALQMRRDVLFALLALLTLAASPLAFLLLALVVAALALACRPGFARSAGPGVALLGVGVVGALLWRLFPAGGVYPFSTAEFAVACAFFGMGATLTWRVSGARPLCWVFLVFLAACSVTFIVPSSLGENVTRLRLAALPITVLVLSLRHWRPRWAAYAALGLAAAWNVSPFVVNLQQGLRDRSDRAAYWQPVIDYLRQHQAPGYRVEAVDTVDHWEAVYLPRAGFPIARGWFRQDDLPFNSVLYNNRLTARVYIHWLHDLGVRWVVLTSAEPDYSARAEERLLRSGKSGLRPVFRTTTATIFSVPSPLPIVTGRSPASVLALGDARVVLGLSAAGRYRVAIRYSPYWHTTAGCLTSRRDGMLRLTVPRPGTVTLSFGFDPDRVLAALMGDQPMLCRGPSG